MPLFRIQYSKKGPARYIAHLDLMRVFERAARRAGLPLAFTGGFNPHPKISFAAPLAVGIEGEAEYVEIELSAALLPSEVVERLSASMPAGITIKEAHLAPEGGTALMAMVDLATYQVEGRASVTLTNLELESAINDFLALPEIYVERRTKGGRQNRYDIRPGIFFMSGRLKGDIIFFEMELKTGSAGNIRVDEVLAALRERFPALLKTGGFTVRRAGIKFKTAVV